MFDRVDVQPSLSPAAGIGAATARLAGKRGWSVAINYVGNAGAAQETAAAVEAGGGKAILVKGNIAEEADVVALFDATVDAFGGVDGVVNNAGIIVAPPRPLADMPLDRIRQVMAVNVVGAYLVAREGVRRTARTAVMAASSSPPSVAAAGRQASMWTTPAKAPSIC
jgi:NAD(P)-dependent dehydrogenase (short-subunit alcohol dehydrogenase family)